MRRVLLLALSAAAVVSGVLGFVDVPPGTSIFLVVGGLLMLVYAVVL